MKGLLIGTGYMGVEYCKVLQGLQVEFDVIGRGENNAEKFQTVTKKRALTGGVEKWSGDLKGKYDFAIVAVEVDVLFDVANHIIDLGIKKILLEKPGSSTVDQLKELQKKAEEKEIKIYIAYNRRFYESVIKAEEMLETDADICAVNFEFTEWLHKILVPNPKHSLEDWMFKNSTHVVDLAFYFAGKPKEFSAYHRGWIEQMRNPAIYVGAGESEKGILFSYQAYWGAPGRWSVEVLTKNHRYYFKPMEELWVQKENTVHLEKIQLPEKYDKQYKPGVYKMTETFLMYPSDSRLLPLEGQIEMCEIYNKMKR